MWRCTCLVYLLYEELRSDHKRELVVLVCDENNVYKTCALIFSFKIKFSLSLTNNPAVLLLLVLQQLGDLKTRSLINEPASYRRVVSGSAPTLSTAVNGSVWIFRWTTLASRRRRSMVFWASAYFVSSLLWSSCSQRKQEQDESVRARWNRSDLFGADKLEAAAIFDLIIWSAWVVLLLQTVHFSCSYFKICGSFSSCVLVYITFIH